jgi:cbb3-type cytochrome oxidase subunit 3
MSLSDIMGHAGLSIYAQISLILFLVVFIAIIARTFAPSRRRELEEASRLPLDDTPTPAHRPRER